MSDELDELTDELESRTPPSIDPGPTGCGAVIILAIVLPLLLAQAVQV
jgi:hypothetical protein